jgi:hypothetical protein
MPAESGDGRAPSEPKRTRRRTASQGLRRLQASCAFALFRSQTYKHPSLTLVNWRHVYVKGTLRLGRTQFLAKSLNRWRKLAENRDKASERLAAFIQCSGVYPVWVDASLKRAGVPMLNRSARQFQPGYRRARFPAQKHSPRPSPSMPPRLRAERRHQPQL